MKTLVLFECLESHDLLIGANVSMQPPALQCHGRIKNNLITWSPKNAALQSHALISYTLKINLSMESSLVPENFLSESREAYAAYIFT